MRLLEVLFYLLKINTKTTIKQLAQRFNVSEKTIQRDLDKLSVLGIPIIYYRGVNGGVELDKNYVIAKYVLTEKDYKDLILSLYISENIMSDLKRSELINKFSLVDSNRCTQILKNLEDRLIIDLESNKSVNKKDTNIEHINSLINDCMDKKSFIKLEVKDKYIEVFPISYIIKKEDIYLYFYDGEYKLISLSLIYNAWECDKIYDGSIVKYNENKNNLKLV